MLDSEHKGVVSEYGGGAMGGRVDEPRPRVLKHYHDKYTRGFVAGDPGVLEVSGGMTLSSWTDGSEIRDIPVFDAEGSLAQNFQFFFGTTLFWAADTLAINKQKVWTEAAGTKDFLTFGSDTSRGVADLGTDGKDLVWIEGSAREETIEPFPKVVVATSPFTTDPSQIQRRELRADLMGSPFGTAPFVVGCGYAARNTTMRRGDGGVQGGSLVVRLSDGHAWHLPDGPGVAWGWRRPLALTCDELFILVAEALPSGIGRFNIARVRLDSLGPPMPP